MDVAMEVPVGVPVGVPVEVLEETPLGVLGIRWGSRGDSRRENDIAARKCDYGPQYGRRGNEISLPVRQEYLVHN